MDFLIIVYIRNKSIGVEESESSTPIDFYFKNLLSLLMALLNSIVFIL